MQELVEGMITLRQDCLIKAKPGAKLGKRLCEEVLREIV